MTASRPDQRQSLDRRDRMEARVLDGLRGDIDAVRVSIIYRIGLLFVTLLMVLLPAAYVIIIATTAGLVYQHATTNLDMLSRGRGGILGYLLPVFIGPILILFLIKPLFARRGNQQVPRRLKRSAEPFLYGFVKSICRAVNAPVPNSIRVNCEVNASAGFRRGILSMFENDLTLTIGLPLVKGLTLRQLSGVLAHEFGHFSQGAGMRLTYIIRTINAWFFRVVHERDEWDEKLTSLTFSGGGRFALFFWIARIMIWFTRCILYLLMMLGHVVSCFMMRQMEFDADRYEARLSGSEDFEETHRQLVELTHAWQLSLEEIVVFWDDGRLVEDIADYVVMRRSELSGREIQELHSADEKRTTGWFDTHPASRDRIDSAIEEESDGIISFDHGLPAKILFRNFERLCVRVSLEFYRQRLDETIRPDQLFPVAELQQRKQIEQAAEDALPRYFQQQIAVLRPLPLSEDALKVPIDPKATRDFMRSAREAMLQAVDDYRQQVKELDRVEEQLMDSILAIATLKTGLKIKSSEFGLQSGTMEEAERVNETLRREFETISRRLAVYEDQAAIRLACALQLLQVDRVTDRIPNGDEIRAAALALVPEAIYVSDLMVNLPAIRTPFAVIIQLASLLERHDDNPRLGEHLQKRTEALIERLANLQNELVDHAYPFDHARPDMTLRDYALPEIPDSLDLEHLLQSIEQLTFKLGRVQIRLFAHLAHAAELVEDAFGLPRLDEPPEESAEDAKN